MNMSEIVLSVEVETESYLNELANVNMEQLCRKPSDHAWSVGQMMVHLMNSARFMQLRNVETCREAANPGVRVGGTKNERGEAAFREGSLPFVQVPPTTPGYTPTQPQSKEEIRVGMEDVIVRMRAVASTLDEIPSENTVEHPGFGYLNAREWFQLIEMHYRHHRHQLGHLKEFLEV